MADHWMHRQLSLSELGNREVDRAGSHQGELVVPGFPLGAEVAELPSKHSAGSSGQSVGQVVGYYRGNVVVKEPRHGTTHHVHPNQLEVVPT